MRWVFALLYALLTAWMVHLALLCSYPGECTGAELPISIALALIFAGLSVHYFTHGLIK